MRKSLNRARLLALITVFLLVILIVWLLNAITVDLNSFQYLLVVNHSADLNKGIGTAGDNIYATRLQMQTSSNVVLRVAACLPFWGRLLITAVMLLATYVTLRLLIRNLLDLQKMRRHGR